MSLTKSIGKSTIGGGKKMNVDLKTYNRSTHDLSYAWRSTMAPGTGVPFMKILGLPGDTFEMDLNHLVMTHPTVGPLFGSYKLQADIFSCPIRLYNALLHNNALNIGMNIKEAKLPQLEFEYNVDNSIERSPGRLQIEPSSLLAYLGTRGLGDNNTGTFRTRRIQATPIIAYYDIFKNYYANKQEEDFYTIASFKPYTGYTSTEKTAYTTDGMVKYGYYIGIPMEEIGLNLMPNEVKQKNIKLILSNIFDASKKLYYALNLNDPNIATLESTVQNWTIGGVEKTMAIWKINDGPGENKYSYYESMYNADERYLKKYKLEEIDNLREYILGLGKNQLIVNDNSYNSNMRFLWDLVGKKYGVAQGHFGTVTTQGIFENYQMQLSYNVRQNQYGLFVKTYQSDIFNNWINTEWIDGENGINAITAVKIDTESNSFQLDTLNLAKKVYDMLNRIAVSGGTYQDWQETVYTAGTNYNNETPVYEGGFSAEIEFQQVVSNSATADEPLGTLAGRGTTNGQKGGRVVIKINEPSYIIGIVSITPRVDYCQGNDFDINFQSLDDLHKPALDAIGFQDRMCETLDWASVMLGPNNVLENGSIGKQPAWIDYMTNFNKTYGNFAIRDNEAFMVLNRWFESNAETKTGDYTTYIEPTKYNYIFADTDLNAQNFWVQIGCGIKARRVISAKVIPNL